jgi:hypothetical protein
MGAIRGEAILTLLLASLAISWSCGGDRITRGPRKFPDERATIEHFRKHQAAFHQLAVDWLGSRADSLCTLGTDSMLWGNDPIYKSGGLWTRRVLAKDGWVDRSFKSLDEAAATAGTTGKDLSNWQGQMLELSVECIKTIPITYRSESGRYVQCTFPPIMHSYGLRFTPGSDAVASHALARWASIPPPPGMSAMRAVDSGWFYFEGRAYSHAPFSEISGKVLYADREPATKINVRLEPAFGESPNTTDTDEVGRFRETWLSSGRYRIVVAIFDPSIRTYRTWFYPGVLDSDAAKDILLAEDESVDVGTWTVPMDPPKVDRQAESIVR